MQEVKAIKLRTKGMKEKEKQRRLKKCAEIIWRTILKKGEGSHEHTKE